MGRGQKSPWSTTMSKEFRIEDDLEDLDATVERTGTNQNTNPGQGGNTDDTLNYFSTGPNGVVVNEVEFTKINFGAKMETVNLRFDAAMLVAFGETRPGENPQRQIPLQGNETPFTIGGANPINAEQMWVAKQAESDPDVNLKVIAYK